MKKIGKTVKTSAKAVKKHAPRRARAGAPKPTPEPVRRKQRAAPGRAKARKVAKKTVKAGVRASAKQSVRPTAALLLTPYLTVADAASSLAFYAQAFGFTPGETISAPDRQVIHATMHYQGAVAIKFSPEGIWSGSMRTPATSGAENPVTLYVSCADVDGIAAMARAAGATILSEPADMFWGERMARIADPDGYVWSFATRVGEFDPDKMPVVVEERPDAIVLPDPSTVPGSPDSADSPDAPDSDLDFEF